MTSLLRILIPSAARLRAVDFTSVKTSQTISLDFIVILPVTFERPSHLLFTMAEQQTHEPSPPIHSCSPSSQEAHTESSTDLSGLQKATSERPSHLLLTMAEQQAHEPSSPIHSCSPSSQEAHTVSSTDLSDLQKVTFERPSHLFTMAEQQALEPSSPIHSCSPSSQEAHTKSSTDLSGIQKESSPSSQEAHTESSIDLSGIQKESSPSSHEAHTESSTDLSDLQKESSSTSLPLSDMEASTSSASTEWRPQRQEYLIMLTIAFISLVVALDATILVSVLPTLAVDLHGYAEEAFWAGTSYLLSSAVFQPFIADLSDIFGRQPLIQSSLVFFTAGSIICARAGSFPVLLAGRCVKGIGGGGIITMGQVVFADIVPLRQRAKWFALVLVAWALGKTFLPITVLKTC